MLKKLIIVLAVIIVPTAFYIASKYGQLEEVTFVEAVTKTETNAEGDQAPKVIIVSKIEASNGADLTCSDKSGKQFQLNYTGSEPRDPFAVGQTLRFVGHVHGGSPSYFHAMQVYGQ